MWKLIPLFSELVETLFSELSQKEILFHNNWFTDIDTILPTLLWTWKLHLRNHIDCLFVIYLFIYSLLFRLPLTWLHYTHTNTRLNMKSLSQGTCWLHCQGGQTSWLCLNIVKAVLMSWYCLYILYNFVKVFIFYNLSSQNIDWALCVHMSACARISACGCIRACMCILAVLSLNDSPVSKQN